MAACPGAAMRLIRRKHIPCSADFGDEEYLYELEISSANLLSLKATPFMIGRLKPRTLPLIIGYVPKTLDSQKRSLVDFLFGEYFQGVTPLPDTTPYVTDLDDGETETQVEKAIIDSSAYSDNPPEPAAGAVGRRL